MSTRRMLCVFAHPDDECLGPGATIARYAIEGVEIYMTTFTCGEAGSIGISNELDPDELCRRRVGELADACDALGITDHRIIGVPDKGVADVDREWAIAQITKDIDRYKPHVLMTFHHAGVSRHPDHIAVASYLEEAFERCEGDDAPLKLYQWAMSEEMASRYDRDIAWAPENEINTVITPSAEAIDRKIAAIEAHVTQIDFFRSLQEKSDYRKMSVPETFTLRATRLPEPQTREDDLFAGIKT
jgi:LmbE family N-acetylglucosaminyl deacetylase